VAVEIGGAAGITPPQGTADEGIHPGISRSGQRVHPWQRRQQSQCGAGLLQVQVETKVVHRIVKGNLLAATASLSFAL